MTMRANRIRIAPEIRSNQGSAWVKRRVTVLFPIARATSKSQKNTTLNIQLP